MSIFFQTNSMPHYRCCVGGCNNDNRWPEKMIKRGHVKDDLKFHYITKDPVKRKIWETNIGKGRTDFKATDNQTVCSNHFEYGKPTFLSPNPTLFLVKSDQNKKSPRKRRKIVKHGLHTQKHFRTRINTRHVLF